MSEIQPPQTTKDSKEDLSVDPPTNPETATTTPPTTNPNPNHNPAVILASTSIARTLTISDQHANILLTQANNNNVEEKALLKLTLVPFHKTDLACLPPVPPEDEEELTEEERAANQAKRHEEEKNHSAKVLAFLSKFDWRMTSESGAEYSYHEVFPKPASSDDDKILNKEAEANGPPVKRAKTTTPSFSPSSSSNGVLKAELIFPASERQVARAMPSPGFVLIMETPKVYQQVTKPFIESIVSSGSLSWLQNIVQAKKEQERLLWNADGWILNIDTKWRTHPDALTVPREEWFQHESTADLYCLGILKQDGIAGLRDLTGEHIPILCEMLEQGPKVIEEIYGVKKDQLRIFVHYQPQFYHFYVHYTRLENEVGAQVEKAHLLSDIIQDLESDPNCFQKKVMTYKVSLKDKLYQLMTRSPSGYAGGDEKVAK